jgi:hypothetical protein
MRLRALPWSLSAALTCIRTATCHAGLKENDEIVELGFISTMSRNRNTQFESRMSVRGCPDIDRFAYNYVKCEIAPGRPTENHRSWSEVDACPNGRRDNLNHPFGDDLSKSTYCGLLWPPECGTRWEACAQCISPTSEAPNTCSQCSQCLTCAHPWDNTHAETFLPGTASTVDAGESATRILDVGRRFVPSRSH